MRNWKGVAGLIIVAVIVVYHVGVGLNWFPPYWEMPNAKATTAKEAYAIAASYALAGEPNAYLTEINIYEPLFDDGKSVEWQFIFYAPDGRYIFLYVKNKEISRVLADYTPSEAWARAAKSDYALSPLGEWVDTPAIAEDAFRRERESTNDPPVRCILAGLKHDSKSGSDVWRIRLIDSAAVAYGGDYYYNSTDGTLIRIVPVHEIP